MCCRRSDPRSAACWRRPVCGRAAVRRAARAARQIARGVVLYAHEWMRDMPNEAWKARHTYSLWAFPQADYPKLLARVLRVLQGLLQGTPVPRPTWSRGASRLHQDRGSLFSVSYCGPAITLEPSSTGEQGWDDFLIDFNDFAAALGRYAHFQSDPCPAARTRGQGVRRTREAVSRAAPADGSAESIAQQLFRPSAGLGAGRSDGRLEAGDDFGLDGFELGVADELGVEHFARLPQSPCGFRFAAGGIRAP